MAVTRPKVDLWLVRTVAVLVLASGFVFLSSALRKNMAVEVLLLAILNGLRLAAIDLTYVAIGRISPIYLGDALIEIILCVAYGIAWVSARAVPTETVSRV